MFQKWCRAKNNPSTFVDIPLTFELKPQQAEIQMNWQPAKRCILPEGCLYHRTAQFVQLSRKRNTSLKKALEI